MQQSRFSVLTGHLNDYPLPDLVGILRHQQKTGRLLIEYPKCPAMLFFKEGELVDAQFDQLSGLQAICVAFVQPPSSFNFNPLIKPYRRSIESSMQKAVSEFLGCWDEGAVEVEKAVPEIERQNSHAFATLPSGYSLSVTESLGNQLPESKTLLALPPAPVSRYSPPVMAMAAAGLLMLGVSAFIGVSRGVVPSVSSATPTVSATAPHSEPDAGPSEKDLGKDRPSESRAFRESTRTTARESSSPRTARATAESKQVAPANTEQVDDKSSNGGAVKVILQVENGRVTQASIGNRKPGMEAYEAMALRIARQRRYPAASSGQQTVMIKVD